MHELRGYQPWVDYNTDLERSVIAVLLLFPTSYGQLRNLLNEDCFYDPGHKTVFGAIQSLWLDQRPIDMLTVTHFLYQNKVVEIEHVNTAYYIAQISSQMVLECHSTTWCLNLKELALKRQIKAITENGMGDGDPLDIAEQIKNSINDALSIRATDDWIDASKAALEFSKHREEVEQGRQIGIPTSIPSIDNLNGGFRAGHLVILAARPGVGKSALMNVIGLNMALRGQAVGIITLEMSTVEIMSRMMSLESMIPYHVLDREQVDAGQSQQMANSLSKLASLPLYFSNAHANIHDIHAKVEKLKKNSNLSILFVDYLQLIEETDKKRNREQNVSEISRGLKKLAMKLQIPIVALAQLNRQSAEKPGEWPRISHLRESGSLEQDADVVMLLHSDFKSGKEQDAEGHTTENEADLIVAKWRNGATCVAKLDFQKQHMRFVERGTFQQPDRPNAGINFRRINNDDTPF